MSIPAAQYFPSVNLLLWKVQNVSEYVSSWITLDLIYFYSSFRNQSHILQKQTYFINLGSLEVPNIW